MMNKVKTKDKILHRFLLLFGLLCSVFLIIVFYLTFLYAYFFNDHWFIVNINFFGEANAELLLLSVSVALILYSMAFVFRKELMA